MAAQTADADAQSTLWSLISDFLDRRHDAPTPFLVRMSEGDFADVEMAGDVEIWNGGKRGRFAKPTVWRFGVAKGWLLDSHVKEHWNEGRADIEVETLALYTLLPNGDIMMTHTGEWRRRIIQPTRPSLDACGFRYKLNGAIPSGLSASILERVVPFRSAQPLMFLESNWGRAPTLQSFVSATARNLAEHLPT